MKLAIAQIDLHAGDVEGNARRILRARDAAGDADLVVTPEFSVGGYPPEDLVLKPAFLAACARAVTRLAQATADGGPGLVVGGPLAEDGKLYNAAFVLDAGAVVAVVRKHELPNYGVFDEKRVFDDGPLPEAVPFRGVRLGLCVCEDWWFPRVAAALRADGADLLLTVNGSPYEVGKQDGRIALARQRVAETGLPYVFVGLVAGQDELVFDGASFVLGADGVLAVQLACFEEQVRVTEWSRPSPQPAQVGKGRLECLTQDVTAVPGETEAVYRALMLGLSDYVRKNGFPGVLLGLSGGIDSALSAAVAVDALGADAVRAYMLPSAYTSQDSLDDAAACAGLLGIACETISIAPMMAAMDSSLADAFHGRAADVTEENIQSRIRGNVLMALSNKLGAMLLTTGNKSELSVGYATLYGDMCGGYSVLKDVYKTMVFDLCRWRNAHSVTGGRGPAGRVMPDRVVTKAPSAELKHDQTDQDTLPPYAELDAVLRGLVEGEASVDALVAEGFSRETVVRVWKLLDRAEYKRRQSPPGVKITSRAFGRDRRYPITNGFTGLVA